MSSPFGTCGVIRADGADVASFLFIRELVFTVDKVCYGGDFLHLVLFSSFLIRGSLLGLFWEVAADLIPIINISRILSLYIV